MQNIRKILNLVWNEFVFGGHLLSLGAISIVYTSSILLDARVSWDFLILVYLGTQSVYLYNYYKELKEDFLTNYERTKHIGKHVKRIPAIIFLISIGAVGFLIYLNKIPVLIFYLSIFCLGLLYSIFFKKITGKIIGFKSFFVSLIWSSLISFLAIYYSLPFGPAIVLICAFVFLREFIGTSFSDIKDIGGDRNAGLLTLAIVLGKEKLIKILHIVNVLAALPIMCGLYFNFFPKSSLALLLTIPYTFYYLKKAANGKERDAFLYGVLVDGEDILWTAFILSGKFLFQ